MSDRVCCVVAGPKSGPLTGEGAWDADHTAGK